MKACQIIVACALNEIFIQRPSAAACYTLRTALGWNSRRVVRGDTANLDARVHDCRNLSDRHAQRLSTNASGARDTVALKRRARRQRGTAGV